MNYMRKISLFLAAALISLSAMAETAKISPTWEANYRTNNNTPTSWQKVTLTEAQFEIYNGSRFFAIQTWSISNVSKVTKLEFMYQRVSGQSNNGDISFWFFPYNNMVESQSDFSLAEGSFLDNVYSLENLFAFFNLNAFN